MSTESISNTMDAGLWLGFGLVAIAGITAAAVGWLDRWLEARALEHPCKDRRDEKSAR